MIGRLALAALALVTLAALLAPATSADPIGVGDCQKSGACASLCANHTAASCGGGGVGGGRGGDGGAGAAPRRPVGGRGAGVRRRELRDAGLRARPDGRPHELSRRRSSSFLPSFLPSLG